MTCACTDNKVTVSEVHGQGGCVGLTAGPDAVVK